jgi:alkylated DNA repair dioxygenase AlkB
MITQGSLFSSDPPTLRESLLPPGFRYRAELIDVGQERELAAEVARLPMKPYDFRGFLAQRRVHAFGYHYDYTSGVLQKADDLPPFLLDIRTKVAAFAGRAPEEFRQVLASEYTPGTPIGWHRDRPQYGEIVGVSLLSPANFRLRRRDGSRWLRASLRIEPRSVYFLTGAVRRTWEHSIPKVAALRYSLTFRTLADEFMPGTGHPRDARPM